MTDVYVLGWPFTNDLMKGTEQIAYKRRLKKSKMVS